MINDYRKILSLINITKMKNDIKRLKFLLLNKEQRQLMKFIDCDALNDKNEKIEKVIEKTYSAIQGLEIYHHEETKISKKIFEFLQAKK